MHIYIGIYLYIYICKPCHRWWLQNSARSAHQTHGWCPTCCSFLGGGGQQKCVGVTSQPGHQIVSFFVLMIITTRHLTPSRTLWLPLTHILHSTTDADRFDLLSCGLSLTCTNACFTNTHSPIPLVNMQAPSGRSLTFLKFPGLMGFEVSDFSSSSFWEMPHCL